MTSSERQPATASEQEDASKTEKNYYFQVNRTPESYSILIYRVPVPVPFDAEESTVMEKIGRPLAETDWSGTLAPLSNHGQVRIVKGNRLQTFIAWVQDGVRYELQVRENYEQAAELLNRFREWEQQAREVNPQPVPLLFTPEPVKELQQARPDRWGPHTWK